MNNAPFYVGQRVVCVDGNTVYKKDHEYTIAEVYKCKCGWRVGCAECPVNDIGVVCGWCAHDVPTAKHWSAFARRFAAIQHQYADITASLASQVTVGDTADQPVRVVAN